MRRRVSGGTCVASRSRKRSPRRRNCSRRSTIEASARRGVLGKPSRIVWSTCRIASSPSSMWPLRRSWSAASRVYSTASTLEAPRAVAK